MNINPLVQEHLEALLALYKHLHDSDLPMPTQSVIHQVWDEILANPRMRVFGGFVEGQLVTSCVLGITPNLTRACKPYGVIENVVTHFEHRRKGYGRLLLQHTLNYAWNNDCYKVMLLTGRINESTFLFYESAGFDRKGKQAFVAKPV